MKDKGFRFVVGARGWQHAAWVGSYYPDDLPPEWRLAYYANDFTGVLLPAAEWQGAPAALWRDWHDSTPPGFGFMLEVAALPARRQAPATDLLQDRFAGWVVRDGRQDTPCLRAAGLADPAAEGADVILCSAADLHDRRALGRRLTALAGRARPPVALVGLDDVAPPDLRELRVLAELVGLA